MTDPHASNPRTGLHVYCRTRSARHRDLRVPWRVRHHGAALLITGFPAAARPPTQRPSHKLMLAWLALIGVLVAATVALYTGVGIDNAEPPGGGLLHR